MQCLFHSNSFLPKCGKLPKKWVPTASSLFSLHVIRKIPSTFMQRISVLFLEPYWTSKNLPLPTQADTVPQRATLTGLNIAQLQGLISQQLGVVASADWRMECRGVGALLCFWADRDFKEISVIWACILKDQSSADPTCMQPPSPCVCEEHNWSYPFLALPCHALTFGRDPCNVQQFCPHAWAYSSCLHSAQSYQLQCWRAPTGFALSVGPAALLDCSKWPTECCLVRSVLLLEEK